MHSDAVFERLLITILMVFWSCALLRVLVDCCLSCCWPHHQLL
jgi:hypothetical protein